MRWGPRAGMNRIEGFEVLEDQLLLARATFSALGPEPTLNPSNFAVVDDDEAPGQPGYASSAF